MQTNYWKRKKEEELAIGWLVVSKDMDGLTGHQVVHALDADDVRRGCYWGGVSKCYTLSWAEAQRVADELNAKGEPAPENPHRGIRF